MSGPVASLDVFDTVLTRRVGAPISLFFFVARAAREQGLTTATTEEFFQARCVAEKTCRRSSPGGEVTLDQISCELAARLSLPPAKARALAALELASELRLICAVPGVQTWLAAIRQRSPRVIFISDMYLPADFLRARLAGEGCWQENDGLYVSCEHGAAKPDGALFRLILEKECLAAADLHHTGNHSGSDFAAPQKLGISATLRADANLNRYERRLETLAGPTQGMASLHAGASRLARLETPAASPAAEIIREVAAGVAGPVLASYVSWLLREARRREITRLYFVARDGHLLLQLAQQLAPLMYPGVELRYFHGSRQAWHLPGIFSLGAAELDWLFCPADFLSVRHVCERVGLPPAEIAAPLTAAGFSAGRWDCNLSAAERARLREVIQDPGVTLSVQRKADAARANLLAYLQQEGLLTADRCALVDIGWHGRAQDSLAKVISAAGFPVPEGFYFGLDRSSRPAGLGERHAWFFDRPTGSALTHALPGLEPLMEVFCTADHGATLGYVRTATGAEPVLRPAPIALQAWGWATLQATVAAYGRNLAAAPVVDADEAAVRAMCLAVLKLFWEHPTRAEAEVWGAFPYENDQTDSRHRPLAETLPWRQLTEIILHGRTGPHQAAWWQGGQSLTPPWRRGALACAYRLRRIARAGKHLFS